MSDEMVRKDPTAVASPAASAQPPAAISRLRVPAQPPEPPGDDLLVSSDGKLGWDGIEALATGERAEMIALGLSGLFTGTALAWWIIVSLGAGHWLPPLPELSLFIPGVVSFGAWRRWQKRTLVKLRTQRDNWMAELRASAGVALNAKWQECLDADKAEWTPEAISRDLRLIVRLPAIWKPPGGVPFFRCALDLSSRSRVPFTFKVLSGTVIIGHETRTAWGHVHPFHMRYPDGARSNELRVEASAGGALPDGTGATVRVTLCLNGVVEADGLSSEERPLQDATWGELV